MEQLFIQAVTQDNNSNIGIIKTSDRRSILTIHTVAFELNKSNILRKGKNIGRKCIFRDFH